ncbi:GATA transcription factor 5-like isoform X2 [Vigna unguiculata]|uniref:GATA transcription factor n=2 Tax=Vigna unguiculata TaxID=3917 RepID=A0A4D6LRI8_VIGUN|nr:GATA transcription factor 5-like isoform X2 [Vigna unguiculata]QCD91083.1 Transcription factor [Vigna unguiculata]
MECMEAALKSNLRKEMMVQLSPETFMEELSVQNGTTCDDFFVDDLLDFSHVEEEPEQQQEQDLVCVSLQKENPCQEPYAFKPDYSSLPTTELSVLADDVADFEWLSHFVEDSFSEFSAALPTVTEGNPTATGHAAKEPKPEPENPVFTFKTPVQTKARSKRSRNGVRVWPLGSPSFTESSSSSTTTTSSSSSSSPSSPLLIYTNFSRSLDHVCSEPKPNKPKKKHSSDSAGTLAPRRCSHCGVQKTPQWRTGPLGPKTLCNACGVRFKSGRLLPEYRPACSPTFSSELHSNHHRKVLEMRQKKEMTTGIENGFTPAPVPKF